MRAPMFVCLVAVTAALLQPFAAEELSDSNTASGRKTVIVCDPYIGILKCPPNTLIEVHEAFYGRTDKLYCAVSRDIEHTSCTMGARALTLTRALCNNRQACQIDNFGRFADPCPGIWKYMRVTYSCRALSTAVSCDDEMFKIQCPVGKYIHIRDGFYGRVSDEHCNRGPRTDYTCSVPNAKDLIASLCDNKEKCEFPRTVLPDLCFGTFKYTTAAYECLDHQTQVVCDGPALLLVECPGNKVIRVKRGFIGRTSEEYCAVGPRLTHECNSPTAHQVISNLCNNKRSCSMSFTIVPDPCHGTYKTTVVEYNCV